MPAPHPLSFTPPIWTDASMWSPPDMRCVLATDMEAHFIACLEGGHWVEVYTEAPIESIITHWMELPEIPEQS